MNIIQSFWSKPAFHEQQNYENSRSRGGWLEEKYLWLSTAYSFYCAKRHHKNVHLVADSFAYEMLTNKLQIPYDDANNDLDALEGEDHRLWILGKVMALRKQSKPFIHVENDVFLWQPLPFSSQKHFIMAQSRILYPDKYKTALKEIFEHFRYIPDALYKRGIPDDFFVLNIGIIGGNDINFFQEYCWNVEQFVQRNKEAFSKINIGLFSNISDEYLFSCLTDEEGRKVDLYIDVPAEDVFDTILRFNLVPFIDKYVHMVGTAKQNRYACEQMEYRFRFEFPVAYKRISSVLWDMFPHGATANCSNGPGRWEQVRRAFGVLYATDVESLLYKKVRLPRHIQVKEGTNEKGEAECRITSYNGSNGESNSWKLNEMDEALVHFESPICINELLEILKVEGFIHDEASLRKYRFKLIDFVTEKITIDGLLEFV